MAGQAGNSVAPAGEALLRATNLTRHFRLGGMFSKRMLHAVDDFDLAIKEREIVALVGERAAAKALLPGSWPGSTRPPGAKSISETVR